MIFVSPKCFSEFAFKRNTQSRIFETLICNIYTVLNHCYKKETYQVSTFFKIINIFLLKLDKPHLVTDF